MAVAQENIPCHLSLYSELLVSFLGLLERYNVALNILRIWRISAIGCRFLYNTKPWLL
jgi:hypothetical protein